MHQARILVSIVFYGLIIGLAVALVTSATRVADIYGQLSAYESADEKVDTLLKNLAEELSFGLYQGGTEKEAAIADINARAIVHAQRVALTSWGLFGVTAVFLLGHLARLRRGELIPGFGHAVYAGSDPRAERDPPYSGQFRAGRGGPRGANRNLLPTVSSGRGGDDQRPESARPGDGSDHHPHLHPGLFR